MWRLEGGWALLLLPASAEAGQRAEARSGYHDERVVELGVL